MSFLYDILVQEFGKREISRIEVPGYVMDNLRADYGKRPYQIEAFQRFILCQKENFKGKPKKPVHLLYNMATGSGKTLIMAGLVLELFQQGYRNFLFFVNSNNIIQKTKQNFLEPTSSKYLFANNIVIDGQKVFVKEANTFEDVDEGNINIKFTTVQQLHLDLNTNKENSISFEDFKDKKIVLIADEAHHLSSATKNNGELFGSWEGTVLNLLDQSIDNILIEFTATLDYDSREIVKKYQDKVLYKYDLSQFRIDRYSKEISLIRSDYDEEERILQALILNIYRQELAAQHNINLKPVILFKAKKTIKESETNKLKFHELISKISAGTIRNIRETATVGIMEKAFNFFKKKDVTDAELVNRIKQAFKFENCISANNDEEAEKNQLLLNSLEDENNPIRAVFAVQKLNEGWDVLNLFDIVRLYDGRDGNSVGPGKTTLAEAQLIGRGARYFPFKINSEQDKFTRKFDDDLNNPLKVLEELYYHTKEDSRYISELKRALIESGIYQDDDAFVTKQLTLKSDFKNTEFYKRGHVAYNLRREKNYKTIKSIFDLGVAKRNYNYNISSGIGKLSNIFIEEDNIEAAVPNNSLDISVASMPLNLVRFASDQNPFYYFNNITRYFPNINSLTEFISSRDYLGGLEITFTGQFKTYFEISRKEQLKAIKGLLSEIEKQIKNNVVEFEGTEFKSEYLHRIFKDKEIRVERNSERMDGQEAFLANKSWYVYNGNYGTSEEKAFVNMFARREILLREKFKNIFLIRNEREIKIYDKLGRAFEPDFILFCKQIAGDELIYQVFIEPKGSHLIAKDKWKEDFLKELSERKTILNIVTDKYIITGVPFYNNSNENEFKTTLESVLI